MFTIESIKKNISKNLSFVFIKQIAFVFLNFISKTVFIRVLGKELLGINSLFNNIMTLISVVEFGIGTVFTYYMYEPLKNGDTYRTTQTYNYFKVTYIKISIILLAVMISIMPIILRLTDTRVSIYILASYYLIYILSATISNFYFINYAVFIANQEEHIVARIQTGLMVLFYTLQIILLFLLKSMMAYLICYFAYVSALAIVVNFNLKKKHSYLFNNNSNSPSKLPTNEINSKIKNSLIIYLSDTVLNSTDSIIIAAFMGASILGMYSNYEFIMMGINLIIIALFKAVTASLGHAFLEKGNNKNDLYLKSQIINNWIACLCVGLYICLSQDFIMVWIGNEYILNDNILYAGGCVLYFIIVKSNLESFKDAAGMFNEMRNISILTALIKIFLSIILVKFLGLSGVLLATAISVFFTSFWYYPYVFTKKLLSCKFRDTMKISIKNLAISFIITCSCYILCTFIDFGIYNFIIKLLICTLYINIMYFLLYRKQLQSIRLLQGFFWNRKS